MNNEPRITKEEEQLLKQHFKGNDGLLKLLRKIFIPQYDVNAPLGQAVDLWMDRVYADIPVAEVKGLIVARQEAIKFLESGLIQLHFLANKSDKTPDELERESRQNSAK